jgi:hypothetical protein
MTPQSKGGQELKKNKPLNIIKVNSRTPQKIVVCCSIAIKVEK